MRNRFDRQLLKLNQEMIDMGSLCEEMITAIVMIAKYFERIGDHASNIAEWVEFAITGEYKGGSL